MEIKRPLVLVAHALVIYAEPLSTLIAEMRPNLDVRLVAPTALETAVAADPGAVVVSDWLSPAVAIHTGGWLLFYPDQENVAIIGGQCPARRIETPRFSDILSAIDDLVARRFVGGPMNPLVSDTAPVDDL